MENEIWCCKRCNHEASTKSNLLQHLRRKNPCKVTGINVEISEYIDELLKKPSNDKTYSCTHCSMTFNSRSNKSRHGKTCKAKVLLTNSESFIELQEQVKELKKQLETSGAVNNTLNNNGSIINNYFNVRNLGQENMAAIPDDFVRGLCMNLEFRPLFENLHFDPNFPENNNIRIKSTKRQQLEIFKDDKWKITPFKIGLNEILMRLHNIFEMYFHKNRANVLEDVGEEELEVLLDQLDEIGKLSKQTEDIKKDLLCAIEENKIVIV